MSRLECRLIFLVFVFFLICQSMGKHSFSPLFTAGKKNYLRLRGRKRWQWKENSDFRWSSKKMRLLRSFVPFFFYYHWWKGGLDGLIHLVHTWLYQISSQFTDRPETNFIVLKLQVKEVSECGCVLRQFPQNWETANWCLWLCIIISADASYLPVTTFFFYALRQSKLLYFLCLSSLQTLCNALICQTHGYKHVLCL